MALPLEASLQGLRESVYARTDHAPQPSAEIETFINRFVNQAVQRLALDMPYAFHEEFIRFWTDVGYESVDDDDTIRLPLLSDSSVGVAGIYEPNVMMRDGTTGDPWPFDRSWDGAYIEITDSSGVLRTNQIRSIWTDTSVTPNIQMLSLVRPFPAFHDRDDFNIVADTGSFTYRIFHPYLWLPDELIELKNMRIAGRGEGQLEVISQDSAEKMGLDDINYQQEGGAPRYAYRRGHFQLQPLAAAPTVAAHATAKWQGPEPYGSFQYVATLSWGKRDYDSSAEGKVRFNSVSVGENFVEFEHDYATYDNSADLSAAHWGDNRKREPLFESAPSPASSTYTVSDPGTNNQVAAPQITFPNIAYQLGYMMTGTSSAGAISTLADTHSGIHIRIYRRRVTTEIGTGYATLHTETSSQKIDSLHALDDDDAFYLLAEFRPSAANECRFTDDGIILPDRSRRLRDIHGYQAIRLHPIPDARYEIEARVVKRPPLLVNDTDRPPVDPVCAEALVLYAASMEYERQGQPMLADRMLKLYKDALGVIGRRYADMRPAGQPARVRPARARGRRRLGGYRAGRID